VRREIQQWKKKRGAREGGEKERGDWKEQIMGRGEELRKGKK
jgi:hypothetical protein